jgi:HEAT repeat protein
MRIHFPCGFCGHKLYALPALAGRRAKCPRCAKVVRVPDPEADPSQRKTVLQRETVPERPVNPARSATIEAKPPSGHTPAGQDLKSFAKTKVFWLGLGGGVMANLLLVSGLAFVSGRAKSDNRGAPIPRKTNTMAQATDKRTKSHVPSPSLKPSAGQNWTGQRWNIQLQLGNDTPFALELGKDFFLYEADAKGVDINGVALFRGHRWKRENPAHLMDLETAEPFGLADNFLLFGEEGEMVQVRGPRTRIGDRELHADGSVTMMDAPLSFSANPDEEPSKSFGAVEPKQKRSFDLRLGQGRWLRDEALKHVFVVLPEIRVCGEEPPQRFRLLVHFHKAPQGGKWEPDAVQLICLEPGEMTRLLAKDDTHLVTRICLANWLVETDPATAKDALSRVARPLRRGHLLVTCLQLMTEIKSPGIEGHAHQLLGDHQAPALIRRWCAVYLGVLKHEPGFKALVTALDVPYPEVAEGAAHGLGAYGGPKAAQGLLARLRKAKLSEETARLADNVLFTKDRSPHVLQALVEMADRDQMEVLEAMARFGPPELFTFFQARASREKNWPGVVVQGLWQTGGQKAIPIVLKMLEKDRPPVPASDLQRSELVNSLLFAGPLLESPEFLAGVVHLADAGNLSATQILAQLSNQSVRPVLTRLAHKGPATQAEIALDGLVRNWAPETFDVFRDALQSTRPSILRLALQGLGRSQNPEARGLLTGYLSNGSNEVRSVAAAALRELAN